MSMAEAKEAAPALVSLECVLDGRKLRMRITSPGYRVGANCQCPRDIRVAGAKYQVPAGAISLRAPRSTYFYHIKGKVTRVADEDIAAMLAGLSELRVFGA